MAPVVSTAEIDRPAAQVYACVTDPSLFSQWQKGVEDGHLDVPGGGTQVGALVRTLSPEAIGGPKKTCRRSASSAWAR